MNAAPAIALFLTALTWLPAARGQEIPVPPPEPEIDTPVLVADAPDDEAIERRLAAVFSQIEGMEQVKVEVEAGVATLGGQVENSRLAEDVLDLARRTEGIIYVQNQLDEEVEVKARLRPATRKFRELATAATRMLPVGLIALAVVAIFWLLGRWLGERAGMFRRFGFSELASSLGRRVVRMLVTATGIVIALEILDATAVVGALLGVAGVAGIALGFAFRNIVENYLAGVLLSARNPFDVGDQLQVADFTGKVVRLTSRDTVLMTLDGNHLRIPNSVIITSAMTNFTRNPLRRFEFEVGVSVDLDVATARDLGVKTLAGMKGILKEPGPQGLVSQLGDSTVQLRFLAWIDQRESDFLKARSEAIRLVKDAFDRAGIEMPEPIYRIHLREREAAAPKRETMPVASSDGEQADVTADTTIDHQVAAELRSSDEENLLGGSAKK